MRRIYYQLLFLFLILAIFFRLISFDTRTLSFLFLGFTFPMDKLFYPLFMSMAAVLALFYYSYKKGRIFCAYACPVHLFLETGLAISERFRFIFTSSVGILLSLIFSSAAIRFLFSFSQIVKYSGNSQSFILLVVFFFGMTILFFLILSVYREIFCKKACPYALFQMVMQTNDTMTMIYDNLSGNCINCLRCDKTCPFLLDVRKESETLFCSNCNRCHDACVNAIGEGQVVLNLTVREKMKNS